MTARVEAMAPRISVIVPTRNRPQQLDECLTALSEQSLARSHFEVIVVDDGSNPALAVDLEAFQLSGRVVRQPCQGGAAAARNAGMRAARGRAIAFTDDDCRAARDWLARLLTRLDDSGDMLIGGRVVNALSGNVYAATSQLIHELAYAHHNENGRGARFFASNNMAAPADSLVRLGGFDPAFSTASEDRDLCARWRESGRELMYAPEAEVAHAHYLTLARFWTQHFRYGRGAWRYHASLRRRGHGSFARDLGFHARFLRRAGEPLTQRGNTIAVGALLIVWQVANLAGFLLEAIASRLISAGPAAKIS